MDEEFTEKRTLTRLKGHFKIQVQEGSLQRMVKTIDISCVGLRFKSPKTFPLFREVSLALSLPLGKEKKEQTFECSAIVVRSEKSTIGGGYNVALSFVGMEEKDKKKIEQFIARASKTESN